MAMATVVLTTLSLTCGASSYDEYARLLKTYVEPDGVDYAAWYASSADQAALKETLNLLSEVDVADLDENDAKALYINFTAIP